MATNEWKSVDDATPIHYQDLVVGCSLAICGNLLISVSLNIQKYTHMKNEETEEPKHYTKNPLWWLGLILMVLGEVGNFSAYGFAPASLVAPLGTSTVVANMILAAIFLKEKVRAEQLFGSALAVIGAFLLVTFSSKKEAVLNGQQLNEALTQVSFIVYICVEVVMLVVLFVLLYHLQYKRVVIYLLITSIVASATVISAKGVSSLLQLSVAGYSQFKYPVLYIMTIIMVLTAIIQVKYLNQAMKNFDSTVVVPTNFVFFTISAIVAGIIFYKEFYGMRALDVFMFLFGCVMSFIGVYFITAGRDTITKIKHSTTSTEKTQSGPQITANIFPSWLLATVNMAPVQPSGNVSHLTDTDTMTQPFLSTQVSDTSSSQETLYSTAESGAMSSPAHVPKKRYGTTE